MSHGGMFPLPRLAVIAALGCGLGWSLNARAQEAPAAGSKAAAVAEGFAALRAEFDAAQERLQQLAAAATTPAEQQKVYQEHNPDDTAFSRRAVELALGDPKSTGARDALLWVIDKPYRGDTGPYGDEVGRAVALLVRHHGDDPEVGRTALGMDNLCSRHRDALMEGLQAAAQGHEARGLARLARAQSLEQTAKFAAGTRKAPLPPKLRHQTIDADGKPAVVEVTLPAEEHAYWIHLRTLDIAATRAEAERLYDEVVADYADVPHVTVAEQRVAAMLREPVPKFNGQPVSAEDLARARAMIDHRRTLADAARARLDDLTNLTVGKPAPAITGTDLAGKPLALADHRGKVVLLVFWGSWCGPCLRAVPHERELAERFQGRPFTVLGVNCDDPLAAAQQAADEHRMTWPNWLDGDSGPIATRYHVRSFPTVFVIDAQGIIRARDTTGELVDAQLETLVQAAEAGATAPPPAEAP